MITTIEEIYRRKNERRHRLAALPFEEKIKIVEQLRDIAKDTAPFRAEHRRKMQTGFRSDR